MIAQVATLESETAESPSPNAAVEQGVSESVDRAIYERRCNVIDTLYAAMGCIFPEDIEVEVEFYADTTDEPPYRYTSPEGKGHWTLHIDAPPSTLMGEIDAAAMFREWSEFCRKAAENIEAAGMGTIPAVKAEDATEVVAA
jgi:hypothetical protein